MRHLAFAAVLILCGAILVAQPSPRTVVRTSDGREIAGTTVSEDTFSIHIRDESGQIHVFDKVTRTETVLPSPGISAERLVNAGAEPHNWPMYWGDYHGTHYSALS